MLMILHQPPRNYVPTGRPRGRPRKNQALPADSASDRNPPPRVVLAQAQDEQITFQTADQPSIAAAGPSAGPSGPSGPQDAAHSANLPEDPYHHGM